MALIFTDVDGTLLDDQGRFAVPAEAWNQARERHTIVLASSRDAGELYDLQEELGLPGPAIAEDGAVVVDADGATRVLGAARSSLLERLVATLGSHDVETLLRREPAAARRRLASLLLPVSVAESSLVARLAVAGLALTPGGRWATVTSGSDKGNAAGVVARELGIAAWIAVGNAANDSALIASAARGFVIRNADGHDPTLAALPGVTLMKVHGPLGWPEALPHD